MEYRSADILSDGGGIITKVQEILQTGLQEKIFRNTEIDVIEFLELTYCRLS